MGFGQILKKVGNKINSFVDKVKESIKNYQEKQSQKKEEEIEKVKLEKQVLKDKLDVLKLKNQILNEKKKMGITSQYAFGNFNAPQGDIFKPTMNWNMKGGVL